MAARLYLKPRGVFLLNDANVIVLQFIGRFSTWSLPILFYDLPSQVNKRTLNINSIFDWSFNIFHSQTHGQLFSLLTAHLSLIFQITFISNQNFDRILSSSFRCLLNPVTNRTKWIFICDIKNNNNSTSTFIIGSNNRVKFLLTSCIP
jgi:hypothetical protein